MKEYLKKLPKEVLDLIYLAQDVASRENLPICLVGGFVRDLLLKVKNFDLDFLVEGEGIAFAEKLAVRLKTKKIIRHKRFGTATLILGKNSKIDVATARAETYSMPACLPVVTPGSIKDDLKRRDFTINAMAIDISKKSFGRLIDFFGGESDLRNKKIRVLHDLSFIDDPTRILRAIRFEQRLEFSIEKHTLELIKKAAKLKLLQQVQPQRLRDELILLLKEPEPIKQILRLKETTGFVFIDPKLVVSSGTVNLLRNIEKQIKWFKGKYSQRRNLDNWLIFLLGLVDNLPQKRVKLFLRSFVFSAGENKRILSFKQTKALVLRELIRPAIKPARIFSLLEPLAYEVTLALKAKYPNNRNFQNNLADFFEIYNGVRLSIGGKDLHNLGVKPGPLYKKIFSEALTAKLNGKIKNRAEELAFIRQLIAKE